MTPVSLLETLDRQIADLQLALAEKADAHAGAVMPGFTHLQSAQPVTFGHHMLAYVEMLARDRGRVHDARERLNECPLGAAALAGTGFPIDRFHDRLWVAGGHAQPLSSEVWSLHVPPDWFKDR